MEPSPLEPQKPTHTPDSQVADESSGPVIIFIPPDERRDQQQPEGEKTETLEQRSRLARGLGGLALGASRVRGFAKRGTTRIGETIGNTKDYSVIALNGIRRIHDDEKIDKKIERLKVSAEVHKEVARVMIDHRPRKPGLINSELVPVTFGERRQMLRASRRQSEANVINSAEQYRLRRVWGDDIDDSEGYEKRIQAQRQAGRISGADARRALKASKHYRENREHVKELSGHEEHRDGERRGKVYLSSQGEDIPGLNIAGRIQEYEALKEHQARLRRSTVRRHESIEKRRQHRQARKSK